MSAIATHLVVDPAIFSDGKPGFHSNRGAVFQLANEKFRSKISSQYFSRLTKILAPMLESGANCELYGCTIGEVISNGSFTSKDGTRANVVSSRYNSTLEKSEFGELKTQGFLTAVETKARKMTTHANATLTDCTVNNLVADYTARVVKSTLEELKCRRLEAENSKFQNVEADTVEMKGCTVTGTVTTNARGLTLTDSNISRLFIKKSSATNSLNSLAEAIKDKRIYVQHPSPYGYHVHFGTQESFSPKACDLHIPGVAISGTHGNFDSDGETYIKVDGYVLTIESVQAALNGQNAPKPKPVTVRISGGSIGEVEFEEADGVVEVENNGKVNKVINGR